MGNLMTSVSSWKSCLQGSFAELLLPSAAGNGLRSTFAAFNVLLRLFQWLSLLEVNGRFILHQALDVQGKCRTWNFSPCTVK